MIGSLGLRILPGALAALGVGTVVALSAMDWLAREDPEIASQAAEVPPASVSTPEPSGPSTSEIGKGPRFDTVRIQPDGSGLLAGQAEPGTTVAVLVDDAEVAEVLVDADGRFVAFLDLAAGPPTVVLSLRDAGGTVSEETVVVALPATVEAAPMTEAPPGPETADIQADQTLTATPPEETSEPLGPARLASVEQSVSVIDPEAASPSGRAEAVSVPIDGLAEGAQPSDPRVSGSGTAPSVSGEAASAVDVAQDDAEAHAARTSPNDEEPGSDEAPAGAAVAEVSADPEAPAPVRESAAPPEARSPFAGPLGEVGTASGLGHVAADVPEASAAPPAAPAAPDADPTVMADWQPAPAPTSSSVASILTPNPPDAVLEPQGISAAPTVAQSVAGGGEDADAAFASLVSSPTAPRSLEGSARATPSPPSFASAAGFDLRPSRVPHPVPQAGLEAVGIPSDVETAPTPPSGEALTAATDSTPRLEADISPEVEPAAASVPVVEEGGPVLPTSPAQVEAGQATGLVSDVMGVRVLQSALPPAADPELLSTVALDAIAYNGAGDVTASGRGPAGRTIRLYIDNVRVGEAVVGSDGLWTAPLSAIEPGVYTLRLDQVDRSGRVVSRIETPFQRERRSDLAALMAEAQVARQTIAVRVVQPGNTLWAIARDRYGEPLMYVRVFEANRDRIRDPDLIYPGQVFVLPATEGR